MGRLSVLFVAPHPVEGPSTRYRIIQYLPALDAARIDYQVRPFLSSRLAPTAYIAGSLAAKFAVTAWGSAQRLADIVRAARSDLVYVLREAYPIGPPVLERVMEGAAGRLAFDFDDATYQPALNYANPLDRFRDWDRPAKLIARARRVIAGSDLLADYARAHTPDPNRVIMIPTVVDTDRVRPDPRPPDGAIVVGWTGTPRNTGYIRRVWPALAEAARRDQRIRYVFLGAEPFDTGGVPVLFRRWTLEGEVREIQSWDIGIMPLPDDPQTRGKCGFKLIAYAACGIPGIASPVGANLDVLRHDETGLLADSDEEWTEAVLTLARDKALRREMGEVGRRRAEAEYSLRAQAPRFIRAIEEAAA